MEFPIPMKNFKGGREMISLAITGPAGRMGSRVVASVSQYAQFRLTSALSRSDSPILGRDAGEVAGCGPLGLAVTQELNDTPDVLIDFSTRAATRHWLDVCTERRVAMVIGTTGLTEQDHLAIARAAKLIPIIQASNTSFGVAILKRLVAAMARLLGEEYDIEIVEDHHRFKKDAPSGTALSLANAILQSTGRDASYLVFGRHGEDTVRRAGEIGIHSMRGGDKICDHTVHFAAIGEHFQFMHGATTRDTFARGALRAASWLVHQPPGQYSMDDLLPLTELSFHHLQESELTAPPSINKGRPRRTGGLRSGVHANSHI